MNFLLSFNSFPSRAVGTDIFLFLAIILSPWHLIVATAFRAHTHGAHYSHFSLFLNISKYQEVSNPSPLGWWLSPVECLGFLYEMYLCWHSHKWHANNFNSETNSLLLGGNMNSDTV